MKITHLFALLSGVLACTPGPSAAAEPFPLRDGDRVVLLGNTLIEREQRYGYWETALTLSAPDLNIQFRNLGWSGDTVWGEARAGFETAKEGYQRLVEKTLASKPTVIILGYGANESFVGQAGLARFRDQLNRLLDDLKPSKARLILLAPLQFEKESWPAPNFADRVQGLQRYTEVIRQVARQRQAFFVDDVGQRYGPGFPLTDDGMHLTAFGYWSTAGNLLNELRLGAERKLEPVALSGLVAKKDLQRALPNPPVPGRDSRMGFQADSLVLVRDLKPGRYVLKIDGRVVAFAPHVDGRPVEVGDADTWLKPAWGHSLIVKGPSLDQAEKLRQAIVEKNRLFFNRWRPQNETYLFGFRKYEQGQNASEIPQFDPLIERLEKEISRLRKPVPHTYQLVPAEEKKR